MKIPFSQFPGRHERHYRRKLDNPLFPRPVMELDDDDLLEVQRQDHEELVAHVDELRETVQQAVALKPNEESQVVLDLKGKLDRLYEQACGLADQQDNNKAAIKQLMAVIMATVRQGALGDPQGTQELEQEDLARQSHYELLQQLLVADLLHPDSLIEADELLPSLLSETTANLQAVLAMFDEAQLGQLTVDGQRLLSILELGDQQRQHAMQQLALIEQIATGQSRLN